MQCSAMGEWIPVINNTLLYIASVVLLYLFCRTVFSERVAAVACLLLALWPNYIFESTMPENELLLVPLMGFAALTQPTYLLLPAIIVAVDLLSISSIRLWVTRVALIVIGLTCIVGPWTLRNYYVLDALVPISSNGGMVLLKANNPAANGGAVTGASDPMLPYLDIDASK